MRVTTELVLSDEDVAAFYPVYVQAWQPLLTRAAARHLLTEEEFRKEMADPRIEKFLLRDAGEPIAMTTLTTDPSVVDWINPDFYRARYRDAVERGALFYLGYTLVDRARGRSHALVLMANAINRRVAAEQGVVCYDICGYNNTHGIGRYTTWLFGASHAIDRLDTQTYYAADYREARRNAVAGPAVHQPDEQDLPQLRRVTLAERPDLVGDIDAVLSTRWPTFMLAGRPGHGLDISKLLIAAPEHQVLMLDREDKVLGVGLSLPILWDGTLEGLPDGWDDAVARGADLLAGGASPNAACALSVTVAKEAAKQGVAPLILQGLKDAAARAEGFALLAPVRPILKPHYPLIDISDYVAWRTPEGQPFDPWLRLHVRMGGKVLGVAQGSMVLTGSVEEWRGWTEELLPGPGSFLVPGALAPLVVEDGVGTYVEPNVWVLHQVAAHHP